MPDCTIVVPCYNEETRLNRSAIVSYLTRVSERLICFVDDGSTDGTFRVLEGLRREMPAQVSVLRNELNLGKAESVRRGLRMALDSGDSYVGYWDADLATPLDAIDDLLGVLVSRPDVEVVIGSRVKLLGRKIERLAHRHYLGRAFATCSSLVLDLPVYDTQCGAKLFRSTPALCASIEEPFLSRWIFDVELLARLLVSYESDPGFKRRAIYEFPLNEWRDIPGSKVRARDFMRAVRELAAIRRKYTGRTEQKQAAALSQQDAGGVAAMARLGEGPGGVDKGSK